MARLDVEYPVTRAELEDALRLEGFQQQTSSPHVWWSQDRTKFVSFPEGSDVGEAIYGDSEIGEPGRTIPLAAAYGVVRGELLLDSPLGVSPQQPRGAERALPAAAPVARPMLEGGPRRALPPAAVLQVSSVPDAEFEEDEETIEAPAVTRTVSPPPDDSGVYRFREEEDRASRRYQAFLIGSLCMQPLLGAAIASDRAHGWLYMLGDLAVVLPVILFRQRFKELFR